MANIPQNIGRYTIEKLLGEGAMGSVFRAHDPVIQRVVAIKTIKTDVIEESDERNEFKRRFFNEAQICGSLHHPNIVVLYDLGEEAGQPFIAMEYLEGKTLQQRMKAKRKLDIDTKVHIITQIADALDYAHEREIIHRDIKPQNVMITDDNIAKIMDFGIAKIGDEHMTKTGFFVGTPSYSSPEQIAGEKVDYRSDIFSLGVLAHELLTGKLPFPGKSISSILYQVVNGQPSLEYVPPEIDANKLQFKLIFLKALNKDREKRFQQASDFADELRKLVGAAERPLPQPTAETPIVNTQAFGQVLSPPSDATQTAEQIAMRTATQTPSTVKFDDVGIGATATHADHATPAPTVKVAPETVPYRPASHTASAPAGVKGPSKTASSRGLIYAAVAALAIVATISAVVLANKKTLPDPDLEDPIRVRNVRFESEPSGATVFLGQEQLGTTPLDHAFDLSANSRFEVVYKMEGYVDHRQTLTAESDWRDRFHVNLNPKVKEQPDSDDPDPPEDRLAAEREKQRLADELARREQLDREVRDQTAWAQVKKQPSIEAYEQYIREFPGGAYTAVAERERDALAEILAFKRASTSSNPRDLEDFLNNHPTSQRAGAIEDRLNRLKTTSAYQKALLSSDLQHITGFLANYRTWATPDQIQRMEARLNEFNVAETERKEFDKVKSSSDLAELKGFIHNYGGINADHVNVVRERVNQVDQVNAEFLKNNVRHDSEKKYKVTTKNVAFDISLSLAKKAPFDIDQIDLVWILEDGSGSQVPMIGGGKTYTAQIPHGALQEGELKYYFSVREATGQEYKLDDNVYTTKITIADAPKNLVITY